MTSIVILGGGFGGIRAALDLDWKLRRRRDVKIILIDRANGQTFYPALYEVASIFGIDHQHPYHTKLKGTICIPYAEIFAGTKIQTVQAEVIAVNLEDRHLTTTGFNLYPFDYLVIALGSVPSTFGVPGAEEYAYKFKTIEDGLALADKIEELFTSIEKNERAVPVKIIVGGAGFTGIELVAELSNCIGHVAHRHKISRRGCTAITLIEAGPEMLPMISDRERSLIKVRLVKLGVNVLADSPIVEVGPNFVKLKDGRQLEGDIVIWSGGVQAPELAKKINGLERDEKDRIMVDDWLRVKNHHEIFGVGDATAFLDPKTQKPVPQLAYVAGEQGKVAAENIARLISGGGKATIPLEKYQPFYDTWVTPVGGKYAVAHLGRGITVSGFWGYLLRQLINLRYFLSILSLPQALHLFFSNIKVFSEND